MKNNQPFRPLIDFEKQIDEAFVRYSHKLKKRKKDLKVSNELKKGMSLKNFNKSGLRQYQ